MPSTHPTRSRKASGPRSMLLPSPATTPCPNNTLSPRPRLADGPSSDAQLRCRFLRGNLWLRPHPHMALITPAPVFSQRTAHLFLGTRLFLYPAAPSLTHLRTSPGPAPWSVLRERPLSEQLLCSKTVSDRLVSRRVSPAKSVTVLARPYHLTDVDAAPGRGKRFRGWRRVLCFPCPQPASHGASHCGAWRNDTQGRAASEAPCGSRTLDQSPDQAVE